MLSNVCQHSSFYYCKVNRSAEWKIQRSTSCRWRARRARFHGICWSIKVECEWNFSHVTLIFIWLKWATEKTFRGRRGSKNECGSIIFGSSIKKKSNRKVLVRFIVLLKPGTHFVWVYRIEKVSIKVASVFNVDLNLIEC